MQLFSAITGYKKTQTIAQHCAPSQLSWLNKYKAYLARSLLLDGLSLCLFLPITPPPSLFLYLPMQSGVEVSNSYIYLSLTLLLLFYLLFLPCFLLFLRLLFNLVRLFDQARLSALRDWVNLHTHTHTSILCGCVCEQSNKSQACRKYIYLYAKMRIPRITMKAQQELNRAGSGRRVWRLQRVARWEGEEQNKRQQNGS